MALLGTSQVALVKNTPANAGDIRDAYSIPRWGRSPGRGRGNPLQYSCWENPTDRGAWRATVHGVAKSRIKLNWLSMHAMAFFGLGRRKYVEESSPKSEVSKLLRMICTENDRSESVTLSLESLHITVYFWICRLVAGMCRTPGAEVLWLNPALMSLNCYKLTLGVKTVARSARSKLTVARRVLQMNSLYNLYERISNRDALIWSACLYYWNLTVTAVIA